MGAGAWRNISEVQEWEKPWNKRQVGQWQVQEGMLGESEGMTGVGVGGIGVGAEGTHSVGAGEMGGAEGTCPM